MKNTKEYIKMPGDLKSLPLVSLVFPFEPQMNEQLPLTKMLMLSADGVEKELAAKYPKEMVEPVMKKLRHLIAGILCRKGNMSMCILVCAASEHVYYFSPTRKLSNYFQSS